VAQCRIQYIFSATALFLRGGTERKLYLSLSFLVRCLLEKTTHRGSKRWSKITSKTLQVSWTSAPPQTLYNLLLLKGN
jgi:hypothetical protein